MLTPRRSKYRKQFKPKVEGKVAFRGVALSFGEFGLRAEESGNISSRQIEAARKAITHFTKRGGRIWIRIFPDKPVTFKGNEVGMGGGKGSVSHYVYPLKPGRILFEIDGVPKDIARAALKEAGGKLPVKTKIIEG